MSKIIFSHVKKNVFTNAFISSFEYQAEIKNNSLFFEEFEKSNNLFLIKKRNDFVILYFYINNFHFFEAELKEIKKELVGYNIVCEIPYKEELEETVLNKIISCEFKIALNRIKLKLNELKFDMSDQEIQIASVNDVDEIDLILKNSFDKYTGCLPNKEIIEKRILDKEIIIIKDSIENNIIGVLEYDGELKSNTIKHLAIHDEYRNKGYAKKLITSLFKNSKKTLYTWTSVESDAERMYKKVGFVETDYKSIVLIGG